MAAKPFRFVDLFCGGGGSITGALNALHGAGITYEGRGFNHWDLAIQTIKANHPEIVPDMAKACTPIESVIPDEIFEEDPTRLDVLWASPSCTHHSVAAGGKPRSNQLRSQPEHLLPYLRLTRCQRMVVENVQELLTWGPILDRDETIKGRKYLAGQPDPRKKGVFFNLWIKEIQASGYKVDWQILNSADYGAATSRKRLIIQAVRKTTGARMAWPEPTHQRDHGLFAGQYRPWRSAAEIIDWTIPAESIFDRKKPLCQNTLNRIAAGIRRYWGAWAEPFLILLQGTENAVPLSHPLQTAGIRPIWLDQAHTKNCGVSGIADEPLNTITCSHGTHSVIMPSTSGAIGLVEPLIIKYFGSETSAKGIKAPLDTITTRDRFGLVQGRILTMPDGQRYRLDITHRMLTTAELARATSFPEGYVFCGGDTAAKKQIGNAVPPVLAEAIYRAILAA